MLKIVNNWKTTLQASLLAGEGLLQVPAGEAAKLVGLGAGDTYRLTLVEVDLSGAEVAWEIVTASANASGELTVARGEEGTTARDWPAGTRISQRLTAGSLSEVALDAKALSPVVPVTGTSREAELDDVRAYVRLTAAGASTYTVGPQSAVDWPEDAEIHIRRAAAGNLTLTEGADVTLNAPSGGTLVMTNGMSVTLKRVAENVWDVIGQTVAA